MVTIIANNVLDLLNKQSHFQYIYVLTTPQYNIPGTCISRNDSYIYNMWFIFILVTTKCQKLGTDMKWSNVVLNPS